ncbi:hypothetical protein VTH82DRAFT_7027 [Thermothelomyces myriococcoides]
MKFLGMLAMAFGLLAMASAMPLVEERDDVQTAYLIFHAGPTQYSLSVPADGSVHKTNSDLSVNIIEAPDYAAYPFCEFETLNEATLVSSISSNGSNLILVGPPTPVISVRCEGKCVPTWSDCYVNGQPVGLCCAGFCAANKCRPWTNTLGPVL